VTGVEELTPEQDQQIARRVEGTFEVPSYLTGTGAPARPSTGGRGPAAAQRLDHRPLQLPRAPGRHGGAPARISLYGHGLLGSRTEVNAGNVRAFANEHDIVFCATDWIGMASEDIGTVVGILQDMSKFAQLADRVQQGILNTLFLGRLMKHEDGFAADAAFQAGGAPVIDTSELFYDGNSQGGIIGGAATAVAQDWTRAVLGVPGMNYSLLLRRSSDWPVYASVFERAYPDRLDQTLTLAMIQSQWDRAEANGYAHHITDDPYPGTPPHQVLLHVAYADFQVSMWSAEVMARTIGASLRQPALAPGRHPTSRPTSACGGARRGLHRLGDGLLGLGHAPAPVDRAPAVGGHRPPQPPTSTGIGPHPEVGVLRRRLPRRVRSAALRRPVTCGRMTTTRASERRRLT
jgi:hypothetical protein